jgi:hypothetical protein
VTSHPARPAPTPALDAKDRRMILIILGLFVALLVLLAVFTPGEDPDKNVVPGSYFTGRHGAKAAYTLLQQSGYTVERWEQPLSQLALHADASTVLVLAEPHNFSLLDSRAVTSSLRKGGRVLATGLDGGMLIPGNAVTRSNGVSFAACEAQPEGIDSLSSLSSSSGSATGSIWIVPRFTWKEDDSEARVAYTCANQPVVVELSIGAGHAIWWASSTPLENGSIQRGQDLELFLNSIGPAAGHHIYWDESLHGRVQSPWDFVSGPVWPLLYFGSLGLALLLICSMSRRSGPVRPLPQAPRTTPIEFLEALGSLYRSTGAASTALQIAWERFRTQAALLTGHRNAELDASQIAVTLQRRFGSIADGMEADLIAAEEACHDDTLKARRALQLVRALRQHEETLRQITKTGAPSSAQFHRA